MFYVIQILYTTFLLPPGIFVVALGALTFWLYRRKSRAAPVLAGITLLFYLMSTQLVAGALIRSLESRYRPPAEVSGDVIIMLGGGATMDTPNIGGPGHLSGYAANRLLTAAQLYSKYRLPIIISGGKVLATTGNEAEIARRTLMTLGVPDQQLFIENKSLNTSQNAQFTTSILRDKGFKRPILVTSAFHMERAVRQFAKNGQDVIPFPTDYQTNVEYRFSVYHLLPSATALELGQLTIKEYIGLLVLKWY